MKIKEAGMNEQELVKELAKLVGVLEDKDCYFDFPCPRDAKDNHDCKLCVAGQILALVKEWLKEAGYVKLAEEQNLPDNVCEKDDGKDFTIGYELSQQDMLNAGWRKVEEVK